MQLKVLSTLEEFEECESEWNSLLNKSASHVPFLRHEYQTTWWKTLGGGEWSQGDLHVVGTQTESGEWMGAAPLFHTTNLDGKPALMFIGSIEISDYLDFMAAPQDLAPFVEALLDHLESPAAPDWEVLDLYNFLEGSASLPVLENAVQKRGWIFKKERIQPAPSVDFPGDWDEYLMGIKKKQRHEIRRKVRNAENYLLPVRWYIVEEESRLDQEIEAFLELMALDHHKAAFLTAAMRTQMRDSVHAAFQAGWLQLAFLEIGESKAAAYLNFDFENRLWIYNSAINFDFYDLSPGWVLLAYLIQWGIENGREALDFMRGDEDYKYRFGGIDRFVMRIQVERW